MYFRTSHTAADVPINWMYRLHVTGLKGVQTLCLKYTHFAAEFHGLYTKLF